jgi:hypothetical protein
MKFPEKSMIEKQKRLRKLQSFFCRRLGIRTLDLLGVNEAL